MAAGPVSRLGSFEPGDKTGLRLSPHLAPSTNRWMHMRYSQPVPVPVEAEMLIMVIMVA